MFQNYVSADSMLRTECETPAGNTVKHSMARKSCSRLGTLTSSGHNACMTENTSFCIEFTSCHALDDAYLPGCGRAS